jgi:tetratricopeptide (TPR) repeat protein
LQQQAHYPPQVELQQQAHYPPQVELQQQAHYPPQVELQQQAYLQQQAELLSQIHYAQLADSIFPVSSDNQANNVPLPIQYPQSGVDMNFNQYHTNPQPSFGQDPLASFEEENIIKPQTKSKWWVILFIVLAIGGGSGWYFYANSAGVLFATASSLLKAKEWIRAEPILKQILESNPVYPGVQLALGHVYFATDRHKEALATYQRAHSQHPQDLLLERNLGYLLLHSNQLVEAQKILQKAAVHSPQDFFVLLYLGHVQSRRQFYSAAKSSLQKALNLQPDFAPAWNDLGATLMYKAREAEASAPPPPSPPPTEHINQLLREAEQAFRQAIRLDANQAIYHRNMGDCLAEQKRLPEADQAYLTALRLDSSHGPTFHNRGVLLLQQHKYSEAVTSLSRAAHLLNQTLREENNEQNRLQLAQASYYLGLAYEGTRQNDKAITSYQNSTQLNPQSADSFCRLARLLLALRQKDLAKIAQQRCKDLSQH